MLRPRVMPCLLLSEMGLVKTIGFSKPNYVGDPVNVINIFNKLQVDEVILLDIDAAVQKRPPRFDILSEVARHCTAPLTYGGGISSIDQVARIMEIGVEKVVINSQAAENPKLIEAAAAKFGSQAIIVSVDVKKGLLGQYQAMSRHGRDGLRRNPVEYAVEVERYGAGEILLHSIDRDGTMKGYDLALIRQVTEAVTIPVIACGGAGRRSDLAQAVEAGASAAAAGSLFVYQGTERGVLINFPTQKQLRTIFSNSSS